MNCPKFSIERSTTPTSPAHYNDESPDPVGYSDEQAEVTGAVAERERNHAMCAPRVQPNDLLYAAGHQWPSE